VADRRLAARAKWRPYAGAAPARQAVAATKTPRAPPLAYLLRRARLASSFLASRSAAQSRPPLPPELRPRLAPTFWQKRVAQLTQSPAVIPSSFSTVFAS